MVNTNCKNNMNGNPVWLRIIERLCFLIQSSHIFSHSSSLLMLQSLLSPKRSCLHRLVCIKASKEKKIDVWQNHSNDGFLLKKFLTICSVSLLELSLIGSLFLYNTQVSFKKFNSVIFDCVVQSSSKF